MVKRTDTMPIQNRRQAIEAGARVYWTGRPCGKGHSAHRYTASGACSECARAYYVPAANIASARVASRRGLVAVRAFVYPGDQPAVEAFAAALVMARDLDGPPLPQALIYSPGAKTPDGADIVPDLPDESVETARARIAAELTATTPPAAQRPVDFKNC